ncbi:hypothetical protein N9J88_03310 [Porticoccaceae bacterium]|nr:hypothetical protein [Porticoccaceae bacterium]
MAVFKGDYGFSVDFDVKFDISGMSQARMLIRKPGGEVVFYDFSAGEIAAATVGSVLSYAVRSGDLDDGNMAKKGKFIFQPMSKDASSDLGFDPLEITAEARLSGAPWSGTP